MDIIYDQLFTSLLDGKLYNVVNVGGIVKYFKEWRGVARYMKKLGYQYNTDGTGGWVKTFLSQDEIWLDQKFKKD